jgi:hypothetical protein
LHERLDHYKKALTHLGAIELAPPRSIP